MQSDKDFTLGRPLEPNTKNKVVRNNSMTMIRQQIYNKKRIID